MSRVQRLLSVIQANQFDGILLSNFDSLRYISGYTGHAANIIISEQGSFIITDYRYAEQAAAQCPAYFEVIVRDRDSTTLGQSINQVFLKAGIKRVAFEQNYINYGVLFDIKKDITMAELIPSAGLVEQLRFIKDEGEIAYLKAAANIADSALKHVIDNVLTPGISERDVQLELEYKMQKLGSEGFSFETILLSGPRSSLPHGLPTDRKIENGDIILFDFGARVNGYGSDMTRTLFMGEPDAKQKEVYNLVLEAQLAGLAAIKAGISAQVPDAAVTDILGKTPYAQYAGQGIGHGIGLFLHEQPFISKVSQDMIKENCVITMEPGIYIPDWGGIRIEDDVIVTKEGCEIITHSPKELIWIE